MNYRTSIMQKSNNWRAPSDGSAAHKLLSIELDHHREIQSLLREIKRLRSEVGLMARLRNFHKAQTDKLAGILQKLPPPDIPTRHQNVAKTPDPQNDTTMEERGRPRTRGGSGSDKSTSREDGKKRTSEKGKGREEDKPMEDVYDHTIGEKRNSTSPTRPSPIPAFRKPESQTGPSRSGSRTRAASVVSALQKKRSNARLPSPGPKPTLAAKEAKAERRIAKEEVRKQFAKEEKDRKEKEEKDRKEKEEKDRKEKGEKEKEEKLEVETWTKARHEVMEEWTRVWRVEKAKGNNEEAKWLYLKSEEYRMASDRYNVKYFAKKLKATVRHDQPQSYTTRPKGILSRHASQVVGTYKPNMTQTVIQAICVTATREILNGEYQGWSLVGDKVVKGKGKGKGKGKPQE